MQNSTSLSLISRKELKGHKEKFLYNRKEGKKISRKNAKKDIFFKEKQLFATEVQGINKNRI